MSKSKYYREERRDYIWSTHQSCNRKDPGFSRGNLCTKGYGLLMPGSWFLIFSGHLFACLFILMFMGTASLTQTLKRGELARQTNDLAWSFFENGN
jgi:hypothetical protein